jgi:hypothetical protein
MFLVHICIAVAREQLLKLQDLYTFCKFQSRLYFGPNLIYLSESFLTEDLAQIAASQQHRSPLFSCSLSILHMELYSVHYSKIYNFKFPKNDYQTSEDFHQNWLTRNRLQCSIYKYDFDDLLVFWIIIFIQKFSVHETFYHDHIFAFFRAPMT